MKSLFNFKIVKILGLLCTVWKIQHFSVIQILREINFGESGSSNIAAFAIFGALNFVALVNFSLQKLQKFMKNHNSKTLNVLKWQF